MLAVNEIRFAGAPFTSLLSESGVSVVVPDGSDHPRYCKSAWFATIAATWFELVRSGRRRKLTVAASVRAAVLWMRMLFGVEPIAVT